MIQVPWQEIPLEAGALTRLICWPDMKSGNAGLPYLCPQYAEKTIQVVGQFSSGGQIDMKGTLMSDSAEAYWSLLSDSLGSPLQIMDSELRAIAGGAVYIMPCVSGSIGTKLSVYLLLSSFGRR